MATTAKRQPSLIFAPMATLARWTQKMFQLVPAWMRLGDLRWALRLVKENFPFEAMKDLTTKDGELIHRKTGIALNDLAYQHIKGGLFYWKGFAAYSGVQEFSAGENGLVTMVDDVRFQIHHPATLFVIDEIFAEKLYDLRVNEDIIVLDIGMNVGVAGLFFATRQNVKKVIGFEPLKETYLQAKQNIGLNQALTHKFDIIQAGVSDFKGQVDVPAVGAGSAVFSTDQDFIQTIGHQTSTTVKIDILPIHEIVDDLVKQFPDTGILLKLDCEGEEYKIIDKLLEKDLFKYISVIALEWHFKGFDSLCNILESQGFSVFNLGRKEIDPPCGMIYAFKPKNSIHA